MFDTSLFHQRVFRAGFCYSPGERIFRSFFFGCPHEEPKVRIHLSPAASQQRTVPAISCGRWRWEVSTKVVVTNTPPVGAYRGAGRPEGNCYMERLVDTAAAELGIDKVALRRRNHIPAEAMPHKAPNGTTYDSGEFLGTGQHPGDSPKPTE